MTILAALALAVPIAAGPLSGTLTRPDGEQRAVALIVPGSGPTDRDGNNPLGVRAAPYRMLAEGLAKRGIVTVRIDKRGMFGSKAAVADANAVSIAAYSTDVAAWIDSARKATGARCIWLVGHSEGGLVALASARRRHVCGLVLIATAGRPFGVVIREQLRANPGNAPILGQAEAALVSLEKGQKADVSAMHPALSQSLFNPKVQDYLIDLLRYDPGRLMKRYTGPVLVIHGDRDAQISLADAQALGSARRGVVTALIPTMNHVLKVAPKDSAGNFATYADPALPLAPGLVDAVAGFIAKSKRK